MRKGEEIQLTTWIHAEDADLFVAQLLTESFDKHDSRGIRLAISDHWIVCFAIL